MTIKNLKTDWNLELLYENADDPKIEKDWRVLARAAKTFAQKYEPANYTQTPSKLAAAIGDYEKLIDALEEAKPLIYFGLKKSLNSADIKISAWETKLQQRWTEQIGNKLAFFILNIGRISKTKQRAFLKHRALAPYRYFLERVFIEAKYNLSEPEEQLNNLLNQTSRSMWIDGSQKLLNRQTIAFNGKNLPLSEAVSKVSDLPKLARRELHGQINQVFKSAGYFAEAEMNAIVNYKKVLDEKRGYQKSYSATALDYENTETEVETLVALVSRQFKISQRFYQLHARLLGEKQITLADRSVRLGQFKKKFDFPTAVSLLRETLGRINSRYADLFNHFLATGQIDVYPKLGKTAGAYCAGAGRLPTFILLNHIDDLRSFETLAHEFGHALHTELSKNQPPLYRGFSTVAAEVASTLFEQLALDGLTEYLSAEEKIILRHNRLLGEMSTVFRQTACFNFELEMHQSIRAAGQISAERLAALMVKHLQSYLGPVVNLTPADGYFFVYWSHLRRFFYVYSYIYGQLTSRVLAAKWRADHHFAEQIDQFLSAGRSLSPKNIFRKIGLNPTAPSFFELGLRSIEKEIEALERATFNLDFSAPAFSPVVPATPQK